MARRNAAYEWAGTAGRMAVLTDNSHASKVLWLALALVLLAAALFKPALRLLFAIDYTEEIAAAAAAYGLDPLLVAAVVKVESGFNERARSPKGALGLMQVMPETGAWVARQLSWPEFHPDMLYDPERNLTIGTWYLRHLANTFDGNLVVALAAYNAGQTWVQQWLAEQRWDGREETLADIPFGETRRYVRRVLDTMDTYIWLYDHGREQVSNPAESN